MNLFDRYRGTAAHERLLTQDPRRHPWLRWGMTPGEIARAQAQERRRMTGAGDRRRRTLNR